MSQIRILVCRVDDEAPDQLTELAAIELPEPTPATLATATALEALEATTLEIGNAVLRAAFQAQWVLLDAQLVDTYLRRFPTDQVRRDGYRPITVASRLGTLTRQRQVLVHRDSGTRVRPSDAVLPAHAGIITTRALQEWACLLTQDLPFATAARLLGQQTQEEQILSATTLRTLVRRHGMLIRAEEQGTMSAPVHHSGGNQATVSLVPHVTPHRHAGWPGALTAAVDA